VNPDSVNHDIDRISSITILKPLKRYAMLLELVAGLYFADIGTGEFLEFKSHAETSSKWDII
jgi:hypothetical protein